MKQFTVYTAKWNYSEHNWIRDSVVTTETVNNVEYVRASPDQTKTDDLRYLLNGTIMHNA